MLNKESIIVDDGENGLRIDIADVDGIKIVESDGDHAVYVYYSEIPKLVKGLQEVYNEYKKSI